MVGVPGRSKGCNTCRKRKIACSLERPHCYHCTKSGRQCGGYQKDRVFITSIVSSGDKANEPFRLDSYRKAVKPVKSTQPPACRLGLITQTQSLEKSTFKDNILKSVLTRNRIIDDPRARGTSWMTMIPSIVQPTKALETSAFAVCMARLGHETDNKDFIHTSQKLYGQALQATQRALSNPKQVYNDDTLTACMLLAMYEIFECTSESRAGYLSHYDGCSKLVQLRGPEAHKSGIGHSIFLAYRTMGSFEGLHRRSTFLSDSNWTEAPFTDVPKSPFDRLIDLVLRAPSMLARADNLANIPSPTDRYNEARSILEICWQLDREYSEFYEDLEASVDGPLYWAVFSKARNVVRDLDDEEDELFPLSFEFSDGRVAFTLMLYWATLTILWSGMRQLHELSLELHDEIEAASFGIKEQAHRPAVESEFRLPPLEHRAQLRVVVNNVCQSAEYCMADELGLPFVTAPLNMILQIMDQWPGFEREIKWANRTLEEVLRRGVMLVKHLPNRHEFWK